YRLSEREDHVDEPGDQSIDAAVEAIVNVPEALTGNQHLHAAHEDHVLTQKRPVFATDPNVDPDEPVAISLVEELLQGTGLVEPEHVVVRDNLRLGCHVEIHAEGRQDQTGIDEVGLALNLAGTKVGNQ